MTRDELIKKMARAIAKHDQGWKPFYDVREALPVMIKWLEGEAKDLERRHNGLESLGPAAPSELESEAQVIRRLIAMLKEPVT